MYEDIDAAAKDLADTNAGWVKRRDGADMLGKIAARALEKLREYQDELDVDVHRAVDDALSNASAALAGIKPVAQSRHYTLEELARSCERPGRRAVAPHEDGFVVQVEMKSGRRQAVFVMPHTLRDKTDLIRVFTRCGKPTDQSLEWALLANMKLSQGALAIRTEAGEKEFVLINCFMASETTPVEINDAVKQVAFYGDWVEQKLTGLDDF